ncbi:NAD-dependent epimerase/dehydratase family protein [Gammaproteobacteria bacterium]|nr:NAD-dependent epimerase/dehydratase family protein [Gammaproteobacteria bacterium]
MSKKILIFGGAGFIGSVLTAELLQQGHRIGIVCTNTSTAAAKFDNCVQLSFHKIDIFNQDEVSKIINDYDIIINLIGKLFEKQTQDFYKFHTLFPQHLSKSITDKQHLIHISALGIEESAQTSSYAQTKLAGEKAITDHAKNYTILKPSIVFGEQDNFFNMFNNMAKISPFMPLIGNGVAKFAPVYVEDLIAAISTITNHHQEYNHQIFEAYGHETASFKELILFILNTTNRKRLLFPLPFALAKAQAHIINLFKIYLLTADQVELLKYDNIASNKYNNIDNIIGKLSSYRQVVPNYLE